MGRKRGYGENPRPLRSAKRHGGNATAEISSLRFSALNPRLLRCSPNSTKQRGALRDDFGVTPSLRVYPLLGINYIRRKERKRKTKAEKRKQQRPNALAVPRQARAPRSAAELRGAAEKPKTIVCAPKVPTLGDRLRQPTHRIRGTRLRRRSCIDSCSFSQQTCFGNWRSSGIRALTEGTKSCEAVQERMPNVIPVPRRPPRACSDHSPLFYSGTSHGGQH